jgi:hypothetical protein
MTAKIALAHLNELPNYYTLLEEMEEKGEIQKEIDELYTDVEKSVIPLPVDR